MDNGNRDYILLSHEETLELILMAQKGIKRQKKS